MTSLRSFASVETKCLASTTEEDPMLPVSLLVLLATLASVPQAPRWIVPNFRDLTLKIRTTHGLMPGQVTTLYFKGPRERVEHVPEAARSGVFPVGATIDQCDQRTIIHLNLRSKTYSSFTSLQEREGKERTIREARPAGPEVVVTINSVDTGERREVGGYEVHHIKTALVVEPGRGSATKPGTAEADSWYLDLPGLNCRAETPRGFTPLVIGLVRALPGKSHDRVVFKTNGIEPHGLVIEETSTQRSEGNVIVNKVELLEVSEQALDDSLFEVPADYAPRVQGGSQPEKIVPNGNAP